MSPLRFLLFGLLSTVFITGCAYDPQIAAQYSRDGQGDTIVGPQLPKPGQQSAFDKALNRERPLPAAKQKSVATTTTTTTSKPVKGNVEPPEPSPAGVPTATDDLTLPKPESATASSTIAAPDMAQTEVRVQEKIAVDVASPALAPSTETITTTTTSTTTVSTTETVPTTTTAQTVAVPPTDAPTTVSPANATPVSVPVAEVPPTATPSTPAPVVPPTVPEVSPEMQQATIAVVETKFGKITIELDPVAAPVTVDNFRKLALSGFYDGTTFHRIIPDFMIQGGDPNSKTDDRATHGKGGPDYTLQPEIKLKHKRGSVAMARLPDSVNPLKSSNGSQFYICIIDCPFLDNQYTVFGTVTSGMDVVDKISTQPRDSRDNPLVKIPMKVKLVPKSGSTAAPAVNLPATTAPVIDTSTATRP